MLDFFFKKRSYDVNYELTRNIYRLLLDHLKCKMSDHVVKKSMLPTTPFLFLINVVIYSFKRRIMRLWPMSSLVIELYITIILLMILNMLIQIEFSELWQITFKNCYILYNIGFCCQLHNCEYLLSKVTRRGT